MSNIDHLGIAVRSVKESKAFYERLGLQVVGEETIEHEGVHVAMVPIGETRIELLEATHAESPIGRFLVKRGEGLHHIAIRVEDLASTVDTLKRAGTKFISEEIKIGAGGHLYVFVHPSSAGGVLVELCEDPPQGV